MQPLRWLICVTVLASLGSGCGLLGGETCLAVDGYTQEPVDAQDVPEVAAALEATGEQTWFRGTDGSKITARVEVESLVTIDEVERHHCGDSEPAGFTAEARITLDVDGAFTIALPGRVRMDAEGAAGLELAFDVVEADVADAAAYVGLPPDTIAVDVEIDHDCTTDSITLSLRTAAASCDGQPQCPITGAVLLGKLGATSSPDVGEDWSVCGS